MPSKDMTLFLGNTPICSHGPMRTDLTRYKPSHGTFLTTTNYYGENMTKYLCSYDFFFIFFSLPFLFSQIAKVSRSLLPTYRLELSVSSMKRFFSQCPTAHY
jgi:hypothetical protein